MTTRIGVLTAGGDAPALNAAIRAVVRTAIGAHGFEVVGFRRGWRGVMDEDVLELTSSSVQGILHRGGTNLAAATDLIASGGFGQMVALQGDLIGDVPLVEAAKVRPVPEELVAVAELFFEERRRP